MAAPLRTTSTTNLTARCLSSSPSSPSSSAPLRRLTSISHAKAQARPVAHPSSATQSAPPHPPPHPPPKLLPQKPLKKSTRPGRLSTTYFDASGERWMGIRGEQPPDPNKANLGKTLRILQERLPTLLQSPLPQEILAPNISLQLFPSTHPHLPTVSGRVAYNAALWTSPIAWNRVPIIGNVELEILAERMTSEPLTFLPRRAGATPEQLVVRWCEKRKSKDDNDDGGLVGSRSGGGGSGSGSSSGPIALSLLRRARGVDPNKAFTGLFIFDFDAEGRILTHTIEQAQEGGDWERGMGAKFVGLTDWLLGGMRDPGGAPIPMFERKRRYD